MAAHPARKTPSLSQSVMHALARRCPVCGIGKPFLSWFRMSERCPHCGFRYERESGYWVGAIIINTAVTEGLFGILFVAVLVATLPDVAWLPVIIVGALTNVVVPTLFYPLSKTLWVAVDLALHPLRSEEMPPRAEG
jgi:uncharacterized protein (DUF983 family)